MTEGNTCGAIGVMTIGGREVGAFVCEREAGHGRRVLVRLGEHVPGGYRKPEDEWHGTARYYPPTPHRASIEWSDATIEQLPDADLFDPDEIFDVDVPAPKPARRVCQYVHDFGGMPPKYDACRTCGMSFAEWWASKPRTRPMPSTIADDLASRFRD